MKQNRNTDAKKKSSGSQPVRYQESDDPYERVKRQAIALDLLGKLDTSAPSPFWPNIQPGLFYRNLQNNVEKPLYINQGKATNFCGYAAFTHVFVTYQPDVYVRIILDLYTYGMAILPDKTLKPSATIREVAGTLDKNGVLNIHPADQLWFLTLADQFKGYLNWIDTRFNPGNENTIWAATNFAKFNKMLKHFGGYRLKAAGSDLIKPKRGPILKYVQQQDKEGLVLLYLNSKYLHPSRFGWFKLRAPTHFVVLYEARQVEDMILFTYWDYGLKTRQLVSPKQFKKMIFGVTTIPEVAYD